jgi:hypothetical protein
MRVISAEAYLLGVDGPWWRNAGFFRGRDLVAVQAGRSVSDLPLRQVYYWPKDDGTPVEEGPSFLFASPDATKRPNSVHRSLAGEAEATG